MNRTIVFNAIAVARHEQYVLECSAPVAAVKSKTSAFFGDMLKMKPGFQPDGAKKMGYCPQPRRSDQNGAG